MRCILWEALFLVEMSAPRKGGILTCQSVIIWSSCEVQAVQNLMREHAENLLESSDGVQREFFVSFINTPQLFRLRQLKALDLGKLVSFAGRLHSLVGAV